MSRLYLAMLINVIIARTDPVSGGCAIYCAQCSEYANARQETWGTPLKISHIP